MKKDTNWWIPIIVSICILCMLIYLGIIFYRAMNFKTERDTKYGVENVLKIDTINIHNSKHEVLLINRNGEERIIHSPKCKCNEE